MATQSKKYSVRQIAWKIVETKIVVSEEISCVELFGHDLFVGGIKGTLYKFRVRKHVKQNGESSFNYTPKGEKSCGTKPIIQISVVGKSNDNEVVVLCSGEVTIRSTDTLEVLKTVPLKDIQSFCCRSPGLCVSARTKLVVYNITDLTVFKTFIVPEPPKTIKWFKKHLCIGFRSEYSIMPHDGGVPKSLLEAPNVWPIIEILPMDEIALTHKNVVNFCSPSRRKTREPISFDYSPQRLAFSFPFLASASTEAVEVKNLTYPSYHFIIKRPFDVKALHSDGSEFVLCSSNQIYYLCTMAITYRIFNLDLLVHIRRNPSDKITFVKYITYLLTRDPRNPFKMLISEYTDMFILKFTDPEKVDLKQVKHYISTAVKRITYVITSFFKQFKSLVWQDLLYSTVQSIFYSKIYFQIFTMITLKNRESDTAALSKTITYSDIHPGHLGAQRRFWLTKESLLDPPSKKQKQDPPPTTLDNTTTTTDAPVEMTTENPLKMDDMDDIDKPSENKSLPDEPQLDPPLAEIFLTPTVTDEEPYFTTAILEDTVYSHQILTDRPKPRLGALPRPSKENSTVDNRLKHNVSQSLKLLFLGDRKVDLNSQVELFEEKDSITKYIGTSILTIDDQNRLIVRPMNNTEVYSVNAASLHYDTVNMTISWRAEVSVSVFVMKLYSMDEFIDTSKKMRIHSSQKSNLRSMPPPPPPPSRPAPPPPPLPSPSPIPEEPLYDPPKNLLLNKSDELDENGRRFGSPETPPLERERDKNKEKEEELPDNPLKACCNNKQDQPINNEHKVKASPSPANQQGGNTTHLDVTPTTKEPLPDFSLPPYHKPITTLKSISTFHSPRDKLRCILQTFKDTIKCVTEFWGPLGYEPVVGADDLVPIFTYIILKAQIPKMFSEMNFIWEFASEEETSGKYGYGYATFQIGVDAVYQLDNSVYKVLEPERIFLPTVANRDSNSSQHLEGILEKRDILVNRRATLPVQDEEDIY